MLLELPNGDYFQVKVVAPGTAGIPYDCRVRAEVQRGDFVAKAEAWLDGPDVQGFLIEFDELASSLNGTAKLTSDDVFGLIVKIAPIDSLGHFLLEATISERQFIESIEQWSKFSTTFPLDSATLVSLCESAKLCFSQNPSV